MTIDLESSLDQLARSVHDGGVAERMTGQVQHMVARIRRRRAARYTATGLVSVGTVAAVAVAGVRLAGRGAPSPVPAATDAPTEPAVEGLACGNVAPEVPAIAADAPAGPYVEGSAGTFRQDTVDQVAAPGEPVPVALRLLNEGASPVSIDPTTPMEFVVVADGRVVATATLSATSDVVGLGESWFSTDLGVDLVACGGDTPLDPGEYEMVAAVTVDIAGDGPRELLAGPWPFTITEAAEPTTDPAADATEQLNAILAAAPSVIDPFPACGSAVPSGDDPVLALDLALGERVYTRGEPVETVATVRTTNGRTVIGNAPIAGALIVLTRDGVVVGRGDSATGDVDILDLAADQAVEVAATGLLSLCSIPQTDAAQDGLPAGMYQAYAVMLVMLKEITDAGGEAVSRSDLIAVRSNPVDILVG